MTVNTYFEAKVISTEMALLLTACLIGSSMLYSMYRTRQVTAAETKKNLRWWIPGTPARATEKKHPEENTN
jgi:tellurite resistance protein TerC